MSESESKLGKNLNANVFQGYIKVQFGSREQVINTSLFFGPDHG